jgi:hypothetical protein
MVLMNEQLQVSFTRAYRMTRACQLATEDDYDGWPWLGEMDYTRLLLSDNSSFLMAALDPRQIYYEDL